MSTSTVSGRVDEGTKRLADMYLRRLGKTPAEVIAGVWRHIADTGQLPAGIEDGPAAPHLLHEFEALRAQTPTGTPLSTMSARDVKKELANRE